MKTMIAEERKQKISHLLKQNDTVKVAELSRILGVSEVTVRNYLEDMEKKGLLTRVHGGAVCNFKPYYSMNLNQRLETNQNEKVKIAEKIAAMIEPDDTIMINSGTTTLLTFRKFPSEFNLNIVTNSISIALEAANNPNYKVVLVGGFVNTKYQFTFGFDAVTQIKNYHADKLILSVDGVDTKKGFTTFYNEEAEVDCTMLECSDKCIVAADHSKLSRSAFVKISDIAAADILVTNEISDKELSESLSESGIEIITVK